MGTGADDRPPGDHDETASGRRRTLLVAGAVALVLVVALVVWLTTRGEDPTTTTPGPGPTTSAPTTPTPTDDPAASATASGSPTGTGSATTGPSSDPTTTTTTTTSTEPAAPAPAPTTIPAGLTLPAEGQDGWADQDWAYQPCGTPVPATGASDLRRIGLDGPEDSRSQSLLVFPSATAATAFLGSLRTAATACQGPGDAGTGTPAVSTGTLPGDWAESLLVVQSYPLTGGGFSPGGDYTAAVRQGSAVAVSGGYGNWAPGYPDPDPSAVAEYRAALDQLAPGLCVFTGDGC